MGVPSRPDRHGRKLTDAERLARIGSFVRRTCLDKLPQFAQHRRHVPDRAARPLLPRDQPWTIAVWLMVLSYLRLLFR